MTNVEKALVPVNDGGGRAFARVDFAWPAHGVFVEFDGRIKYDSTDNPTRLAREIRQLLESRSPIGA